MRLLLDEELLCWEDAWNITKNVFSYTNHTIMTEAMEQWPVPMLSELLPRHAEIIFEINHRFLEIVRKKWPGDEQKVRRMSIVEESEPKMFRMANLAVIGSHTVNGVAEMHTNLVKTNLFADFCELGDTKFRNVTNGVTPRRWILQANPKLAKMYTELAGPGWVNDMKRLEALQSFYAERNALDKTMEQVCREPGFGVQALTASTGLSLAESVVIAGERAGVDASALVGPAGAGKTQLCLSVAAGARRLLGESFLEVLHDFRRLRQVCARRRCLLYTSPSPRDRTRSRMPSSA